MYRVLSSLTIFWEHLKIGWKLFLGGKCTCPYAGRAEPRCPLHGWFPPAEK